MSKRVKSLTPEAGFSHREHKSKKGRQNWREKVISKERKQRLELLKEKELYELP